MNFVFSNWRKDSSFISGHKVLYISFILLLVYGFFNLLIPTLGKTSQVVVFLIGFITFLMWGKKIRTSFPVYLLLAAIFIQVLSWSVGYFNHPEWISSNPRIDRMGKMFIFIIFAWILAGSTVNTLLFWASSAIGIVLTTFLNGNASDWFLGLQGQRVDFNIRNAQHIAMFFGVIFLGLIFFSFRAFIKEGKLVLWRLCLWFVFTLLILVGMLITQTRAIWLAVATALTLTLFVLFLYLIFKNKGQTNYKKNFIYVGVFIVIMALIGSFLMKDTVIKRLSNESEVLTIIISEGVANVPYTSVGLRFQTWRAATEWIVERPIVGWGDKARSLVIEETVWLPDFVRADFGHLHNYFLEILVAYGVLGILLFVALAFWVARGVIIAWKNDQIPLDMVGFSFAFFIYWVIVNQFESYGSFSSGVFVFNVVLAGIVTHIWRVNYSIGPTNPEINAQAET